MVKVLRGSGLDFCERVVPQRLKPLGDAHVVGTSETRALPVTDGGESVGTNDDCGVPPFAKMGFLFVCPFVILSGSTTGKGTASAVPKKIESDRGFSP